VFYFLHTSILQGHGNQCRHVGKFVASRGGGSRVVKVSRAAPFSCSLCVINIIVTWLYNHAVCSLIPCLPPIFLRTGTMMLSVFQLLSEYS